jgi:hypothetical protein
VVVGDFNIPLSLIDRSSKQEILELKDTIDQMDLIDVYRIFHWTTFFMAAHGTFSKIDPILRPKASLSKYKKIDITPCILFHHNVIKLELNSRKFANNWRLNNTLLSDQ